MDFTHPDAVNDNADFYCRHGLPFVMGTTGGDRQALEQRVKESEVCAVIAPNMAKPIVAFQAFMKDFAAAHVDGMKGYQVRIRESHQQGKVDTSGTAKAMVEYLNQMGIAFEKDQIEMIRDPETQLELGVPEDHLGGHGWHTYDLLASEERGGSLVDFSGALENFLDWNKAFKGYDKKDSLRNEVVYWIRRQSPDGTVEFIADAALPVTIGITHNINGRSIYVDGTLDAVKFLDGRMKAGEKGKVYSMIDVLNSDN